MRYRAPIRSGLGVLLGPGIDIAAYLIAVERSASPARAQLIACAAAVVVAYLPLLGRRADAATRRGAWFALHVIVVTALAFCLRSGLMSLAMQRWGWSGSDAIVPAAIATGLIIRLGYGYCASYPAWSVGSAGWRTVAIGMVVVAVALRLLYMGQVELMPEEAYYWNYARHLDIGYLDHPPMVAWLISAGIRVFGDGEFGVRSGAVGSAVIATFFVYRLTRNLFGAPSALVSIVLVQALPFFFLAGMLMTPDSPLTAAWAASLYFLERALIEERRRAWWGAGLCLGAGLLSKYTIALVGLSALIFAVIDPAARRWLRRPEPYGAAILALAVFSPVIWWNAHHDWASFLFQTSRRLADRPQFALHKLIGSAVVLLTPTGFAAAALVLGRRAPEPAPAAGARADVGRRARLFLKVATLTPLAVFTVFSLRHEVKLDWTGAPWLATVPLLACAAEHWAGDAAGFRAFLARSVSPTLIVLLLAYGAGLYDLTWGIPGVGYGKHAELVPVGWRELGSGIGGIADDIERRTGEAPLVVGMDRYAIASELAFYAPDQAKGVSETSSGHLFGQVGLMYERWFPPSAQKGRTLLLVGWNPADLATPEVVSAAERLGPVREGVLERDGQIIRPYYYRVAYGYAGQPVKVSR